MFAMVYGQELPEDKLAVLNEIMAHAQNIFAAVQADFVQKFVSVEVAE